MDLWHVTIEVADPNGGDTISTSDLDDLLHVLGPDTVITGGDGRFGASISVEADEPGSAVSGAFQSFGEAVEKVGLPRFPLARMEVVSDLELDRELAQPAFPRLLGVAELAEVLHVSKQRVAQLVNDHPMFPGPVVRLASGPVWTEPSVRRFLNEWPRRGGRPRKSEVDASA